MTKQEMLQEIYKEMADKTLSFGCMLKYWNETWLYLKSDDKRHYVYTDSSVVVQEKEVKSVKLTGKSLNDENLVITKQDRINDYIIWLPAMIWDILERLEENNITAYYNDLRNIVEKRKDKRKPIDDQTEECIKYVYSLINKNG